MYFCILIGITIQQSDTGFRENPAPMRNGSMCIHYLQHIVLDNGKNKKVITLSWNNTGIPLNARFHITLLITLLLSSVTHQAHYKKQTKETRSKYDHFAYMNVFAQASLCRPDVWTWSYISLALEGHVLYHLMVFTIVHLCPLLFTSAVQFCSPLFKSAHFC